MFAGAVKASGIECGNQFRSLRLFPAIPAFFLCHFAAYTFLFDKLLGPILENRSPTLRKSPGSSGHCRAHSQSTGSHSRHSAHSSNSEGDRPALSCESVSAETITREPAVQALTKVPAETFWSPTQKCKPCPESDMAVAYSSMTVFHVASSEASICHSSLERLATTTRSMLSASLEVKKALQDRHDMKRIKQLFSPGLFRGFTDEVGIYDWEKPNTCNTWRTCQT